MDNDRSILTTITKLSGMDTYLEKSTFYVSFRKTGGNPRSWQKKDPIERRCKGKKKILCTEGGSLMSQC